MNKELYRYSFLPHVPLEEIEATLLLAVWGTASLHGEAQVRLDAAHFLDRDQRACVIDATTPVGRDINRLFVGFVQREFGNDAFRVERVVAANNPQPQEVHG
jgi:hypothetical protein